MTERAAPHPFWCGTDIPDDVRAALDALFATLELGDPPEQWCVVQMVDEADLAVLPGSGQPAAAGSEAQLDRDGDTGPDDEVSAVFAASMSSALQVDWESVAEADERGEVFALFAAAATMQARPGAGATTQRRGGARHVWGSDELAGR